MPRSPSRDLSDRFEGNRRYFHRPTRLGRAKAILVAVALVATAVWALVDVLFPTQAVLAHTHGPVANPHVHWEDDCTACHREKTPRDLSLGSIFRARDRWHDLTCEKCHAGPPHVSTLSVADRDTEARCSTCHHEHGGRLNSLVRISDDHCTRCHAELPAHHSSGNPTCSSPITSFTQNHPEFGALASPPARTLKFSHALHMNPGQTYTIGGGEAMTVARLRELSGAQVAARYALPGQTDSDRIQLNCSSCHKIDSEIGTPGNEASRAALAKAGEPARSVLPPRAEGAYFLPVNFEANCRSCHPLHAAAGASAGHVIRGFDLPHRKQYSELKYELEAGYLRSLIQARHESLAAPARPGGALDPRHAIAVRTLSEEISRLARSAERLLLTGPSGCAKCHDVLNAEVARVPDRTVWFAKARFDHTRHKALSCAACHPGTGAAFAPAGQALAEKEPVQILGIDSCRSCHSPSGTRVVLADGAAVRGGGTRHGCVDCHWYHNAEHGLQGRGARGLLPGRRLDIAEFLRGGGN